MRCLYQECSEAAEFVCKCTSKPIYICYSHIKKHKSEPGKHIFSDSFTEFDTSFTESIITNKLQAIRELAHYSAIGFKNIISSITLSFQAFSLKLEKMEISLCAILKTIYSSPSEIINHNWIRIASENSSFWKWKSDQFLFPGALKDIEDLNNRDISDYFIPISPSIPRESNSLLSSFDQLVEQFVGINLSLTEKISERTIQQVPIIKTRIEEVSDIELKDFEETKIFDYEPKQKLNYLIQGIFRSFNPKLETVYGEIIYKADPGWEIESASSEIYGEISANTEGTEIIINKTRTVATCIFNADIPEDRVSPFRITLKIFGKILKFTVREVEKEYAVYEEKEIILEKTVKVYESEEDARSAAIQQALEKYY